MQKFLILTFFLTSSLLNSIHSQLDYYLIQDAVNALESKEKLNSIEGVWSLNVMRTLYLNDTMIIGQETEENRSHWLILNEKDNRFTVRQVLSSVSTDSADAEEIEAWFIPTEKPDSFQYTCHFYNPDWAVETPAYLQDESVIVYEYFTRDQYVQDVYGEEFVAGLRLHWLFVWRKMFPSKSEVIRL